MPTYDVTHVLITCDCNDTMDVTTVENCTGIFLTVTNAIR